MLRLQHMSSTAFRPGLIAVMVLALALGGVVAQTTSPRPDSDEDRVVLPRSVPDPIEPFNRVMWSFNRGVLLGVVKPTSKLYRGVIPKPVRRGVGNFGRNITYPGRLVNHLLQARWDGARQETDRFFCNTIAGLGGFFDLATRHGIPKSDADFGQTFGRWGWRPGCYLMLPVFGPSNERDALGLVTDNAANPLTYVTPYSISTDNPLTFISPYAYFSYAVIYNNLSDSVDDYARFVQADTDPYALMQYAWTFVRDTRKAELRPDGEMDTVALETLGSALIRVQEARFPDRAITRSVTIPATGRRLKYDYWLRPGRAPVVYFVPGLGSHRRAELVLSLAEMLYQGGYSVVTVSSPFNPEFMENASTVAMPAHAPTDARDLRAALALIDQALEKRHPQRLGARALMGYSMGGFQTLMVAATESSAVEPALKIDRFVALDTPVRLMHGVSVLDDFYRAPLAWAAGERTDRIRNTFLKIASTGTAGLKPQSSGGLDGVESRLLIGLSFRFILRDIIYSSQRREDQGLLHHSLHRLRRQPVYDEILELSYRDYFEKFAMPYFRKRDASLSSPDALERAGDLQTYGDVLRSDPRIRVVVNQNDFLLAPADLSWLRDSFGADRLTTFPRGGHLGNLGDSAVRAAILKMLSGL